MMNEGKELSGLQRKIEVKYVKYVDESVRMNGWEAGINST